MHRYLLICVILGIGATLARADEPAAKPAPAVVDPQQSQALERTIKVSLKYLLYLPDDYEKQASWPLLLFLHGSGERGNDLQLVKKHGPPKLIAAGRKFPFIVVSPQAPKVQGKSWEPFELTALLDDVSEHYKVDLDRVYVTGLSMGGFGTWSLAAYTPERFAAIAPICGGGDPYLARRLAKLPTWVFHGAKDPAVLLERSEAMVEALKKRGSDVKFTVYPEALHDSWTETYENPQLYEWLLQQRRPTPGAAAAAHAEGPAPLPLAPTVRIQGLEIRTESPPAGLVTRPALGLIAAAALDGQVVHRTTSRILEARATITPGGDYLLIFPEGDHYAKSKGEKMNSLVAYRSHDRGRTWQGPSVAFDCAYSQHGFIPLVPRGSKRIYAFGTQPVPGKWTWENGQQENAPIGYRWSDDDGRTWSEAKLIEPVNDPGFRGMSVMRMAETDVGTWLVGSHIADWSVKPIRTKQYLLRSTDQGQTWSVLPGPRQNGWFADGFNRMDEGRPLNLGGDRVLFMSRTPQGHLFTAWSRDDGQTWTTPAPSSLVHPDAPPMLFPLSDGKTLAAFHHNKVPRRGAGDLGEKAENMRVRSELWLATSTDAGHTWSESRLVLANAAAPDLKVGAWNFQCSYLDAFVDRGVMHLFLPHRWQQVLHLTIPESALASLPTLSQLKSTIDAQSK